MTIDILRRYNTVLESALKKTKRSDVLSLIGLNMRNISLGKKKKQDTRLYISKNTTISVAQKKRRSSDFYINTIDRIVLRELIISEPVSLVDADFFDEMPLDYMLEKEIEDEIRLGAGEKFNKRLYPVISASYQKRGPSSVGKW